MKIDYLPRALDALDDAPSAVPQCILQTDQVPGTNLAHPSLHAKRYDQSQDLWQARINQARRFYFVIQEDTYIMTRIIPHPKK